MMVTAAHHERHARHSFPADYADRSSLTARTPAPAVRYPSPAFKFLQRDCHAWSGGWLGRVITGRPAPREHAAEIGGSPPAHR